MIEKKVKDFLNNKITYDEFVSSFDEEMFNYFENKYKSMSNEDYKRFIIRANGFKNYYYRMLNVKDVLFRKSELYHLIYYCMNDENIVKNNIYFILYHKISDTVPEYLVSEETSSIFEKLFEEFPSNLTKSALKKKLKEKLATIFYLDGGRRNRPYWVQESEWPVRDGKPLKFIKQKRDGEMVNYYFENVDNGEITIITQYY